MRIRLLQSIASIFGGFGVGEVVDIPNKNIAASWIRTGIAEDAEGEELHRIGEERILPLAPLQSEKAARKRGPRERPAELNKNQFWCKRCSTAHKADSKQGKRHFKHRAE